MSKCQVRAHHSDNVNCFIAKLGNAMKDAILNMFNTLSPAGGPHRQRSTATVQALPGSSLSLFFELSHSWFYV